MASVRRGSLERYYLRSQQLIYKFFLLLTIVKKYIFGVFTNLMLVLLEVAMDVTNVGDVTDIDAIIFVIVMN